VVSGCTRAESTLVITAELHRWSVTVAFVSSAYDLSMVCLSIVSLRIAPISSMLGLFVILLS
jgi:hypothetical protein